MTHSDFQILLKRRIEKISESLDSKGKEYSTDSDKLHNFKETARRENEHPSKSLQGMLAKHLTSYYDMLTGIQAGKKYSRELLDEKFGDIINYFILQEALFVEFGLNEIQEIWLNEIPEIKLPDLKSFDLFLVNKYLNGLTPEYTGIYFLQLQPSGEVFWRKDIKEATSFNKEDACRFANLHDGTLYLLK